MICQSLNTATEIEISGFDIPPGLQSKIPKRRDRNKSAFLTSGFVIPGITGYSFRLYNTSENYGCERKEKRWSDYDNLTKCVMRMALTLPTQVVKSRRHVKVFDFHQNFLNFLSKLYNFCQNFYFFLSKFYHFLSKFYHFLSKFYNFLSKFTIFCQNFTIFCQFFFENQMFHCHILIQHEKYIQMSTNKPSIGSAVLELVLVSLRKYHQLST